ncbi:Af4/Fmr2 Family Member 1 [Manis pentadactyla]|nr:Af4/Fmr2 Family Member 1 [Manis pentadactyla]
MFCQHLSKAIIKETQDTLVESMADWMNKVSHPLASTPGPSLTARATEAPFLSEPVSWFLLPQGYSEDAMLLEASTLKKMQTDVGEETVRAPRSVPQPFSLGNGERPCRCEKTGLDGEERRRGSS